MSCSVTLANGKSSVINLIQCSESREWVPFDFLMKTKLWTNRFGAVVDDFICFFHGGFCYFFRLSLCAYESCLYSNNSKARTAALMESSKQPFFIIQTHNIMIKKNVNFNGALQDICRFSAYLSGYCLVNPEN